MARARVVAAAATTEAKDPIDKKEVSVWKLPDKVDRDEFRHWKDTVDANLKLGYGMDLREYGIGAQILVDLGLQSIRLLTNNPKKMIGLEGYGLKVDEQLPITVEPNPHNERYLETKKSRMGHML